MSGTDYIYGVLLTSIQQFVVKDNKNGKKVWTEILTKADIDPTLVLQIHEKYPEFYITNLGEALSQVLNKDFPKVDDSMKYFGQCFVKYCKESGHAQMLEGVGRHYRDFLYGIDNLHETMRFNYHRMHSPFFVVEKEDDHGCELIYQSKRRGYAWYVIGQLEMCGFLLYDKLDVKVSILEQTDLEVGCRVRYRLDFDNSAYRDHQAKQTLQRNGARAKRGRGSKGCAADGGSSKVSASSSGAKIPCQFKDVDVSRLFEIQPFTVGFDEEMVIQRVGQGLSRLIGPRCRRGAQMPSVFTLRRPLITFDWDSIKQKQNVSFELVVEANGNCND